MKDKFFSKLDWAAFWTATLATFAVYFYTLGPSVGLEDSGELATAAANLGVPHPPGYPFWTFCSWFFCKVFGWVTYMGHPTPAWCVSLCSAVFGAFAAGCTAMLICRSAHDFISGDDSTATSCQLPTANSLLAFGGGVGGALAFAFSPVEWSQSTIVEIYSLNALFLMWVFLLSYRWMRKPSDKILWFTAFVFGLGLTNYQVLLFAIVPLALIIALKNIGMFRDVFIYLVPVGLTWQVLQIGQLLRADKYMQADVINKHEAIVGKVITTPSTTAIVLGVTVLVGSIVAAVLLKRRGDKERAGKVALYGGGFGAAVILLSAFVFVTKNSWAGITAPVAPLIDPTKYALIGGFVAASVVAAVVAALKDDERLTDPGSVRFVGVSALCAVIAIILAVCVPSAGDGGYTGRVFPWGKSTFMFWMLITLLFVLCWFTKKGLCFAIPVAGLHIAVFTLLSHGAMNGLTHPMSWWFGWPIAWNFILLALVWATLPNGRSVAGAAFFAQLGVSFYAYMPIVSDLRNPPMNWGYPRTWEGFKHAIQRGQYEAIGFQIPSWGQITNYFEDVRVQFTDLLIPFAIVPFAAGHWIVKKTNRKAFWQWMIPALVCFFLMSFLLIALANVKGDLQDGFIQKVKFISSHAMLALWIGYGLVFAAVCLVTRLVLERAKVRLAALGIAAGMILVSLVYPLIDNYCGNWVLGVNEVAWKLGGCEQNDHTFGWQFGAYQLEGAKAINDQLEADEEPLPDPDWPEPMEPFSIFFGGTDPGRFVPTYMIYSANYRPDVYLITQNALADDTYMSVQRDLYGDEIWIPSKDDSAQAFNIYVDEVQRGVRQANGDLKIENGRVQVTGALGVMEINGILTKMMFDHDRLRHSFYVEESYVIPWMYPYLSPHGLIMKINKEQTPYDAKTAQKDKDFWDWYVRRLTGDPMYRRDFAGQKSFAKLRAALAGLYSSQGRRSEAAQAFREACLLYPASPESTFRYAQDILLPQMKWDTILELMDYTDSERIDPNNQRSDRLRNHVKGLRDTFAQINVLAEKQKKEGLTRNETYYLAQAYHSLGRRMEAAQLVRGFIDSATQKVELDLLSTLVFDAGLWSDADKVTLKFLTRFPKDPLAGEAWLRMAKIQQRTNRSKEALSSVRQALRAMGEKDFINKVQSDRELSEIARPLFR